jgi:hypothetical protein
MTTHIQTRTNVIRLLCMACAVVLLSACEDPVPTDYTPNVVIQALLVVGQPMNGIQIFLSQPMRDSFDVNRTVIRDADVLISGPDGDIRLLFVPDSAGGTYAALDTTLRVREGATYQLRVVTQGKTITATTTTPVQIQPLANIRPIIQYVGYRNETLPIDDSLRVRWTTAGPGVEYFITMQCLDTLNYGTYLRPPTDEPNERVRPLDNEFDRTTPFNTETTRFAFVQGPNVFSWGAFKWYGPHRFSVFAGDVNFINYVKQVTFGGRQINENLQSFTNAIGYFGSASKIEAPTFLMKEAR